MWGPWRRLGCGLWGTPGELVLRRTLAWGGRPAPHCRALMRFSRPPVSSAGGPRHHDPEEQVEKIRWQHHFDQLHPQTGRRRARGEVGVVFRS